MPPFIVRYQRHHGGWLAVIYVSSADALRPAAVLTGDWRKVRDRTVCLLPAILERRDHDIGIEPLGILAPPKHPA